MMAAAAKKWRRAKRIVKHAFVPHALILMYHRIAELDSDPHLLSVTPDNFASHLEAIRRLAFPVSLEALEQGLKGGRIRDRAVVVTFDDGYADNLHHATPLLERLEVPATVFVTAGQVGGEQEFWWDELDRLLLQPGDLPPTLRLETESGSRQWELGESAAYSTADHQRHKGWHIERDGAPSARHRVFMDVFAWLLASDTATRQRTVEELRAWAGAGSAGRPTHRPVTVAELASLHASDLIDIGAHTMSHPALALLSAEGQRAEIQQSRRSLEATLRTPVTRFALPHGSSGTETVAILREAGFVSACTSRPDPVWSGADLHGLPRVGVRNLDRDAFESWFRWWMNG